MELANALNANKCDEMIPYEWGVPTDGS